MRGLHIFISHPSDFLTNCHPHGDGLIAYEFIQRLAERGHRLSVACTAANIKGALHPNISLHQIRCRVPSARLQELEYMVRVDHLFRELHRSRGVDVIHQLNPVFPGRSVCLTRHKVPLVLGLFVPAWPSADPMPPASWANWLTSKLISPIIDRADTCQQRAAAVLLLSTTAAESRLREPERTRKKCVLLPCGIDTDRFAPDGHASLPVSRKRILYLGGFHRRKGVYILLEALNQILRQQPEVELVLAGQGPEKALMEAKLRKHGADANVIFIPTVERSDVPALLRSATVVVIPSLGEPFGMVALEAISCGKPIVGTCAGGLGQLIHPQGGLTVPPENSVALADALLELFDQPWKLEKMGSFNRHYAETEFAWPKIIDRLEKIYQSL